MKRANMSSKSSTNDLIALCEPEISGQEWHYVKECLDTGWVSSVGSFVTRFEEEFARFVGADHAIATVNGTSSIHLALLAAGVQKDQEVITSDLTFIAPANAIRYIGAQPVFIDAEEAHWQMSVPHLQDFLENHCTFKNNILTNKTSGRQIAAILPVHILGHPTDILKICQLAEKYNLPVVEDSTESLGGYVGKRHCGTFGQSGCFSFNGNKLMTTGSGGMVVTNDPALAHRIRHLSTQAKSSSTEYIHDEVGYNYRLTNIQAAIGCAQLERCPHFLVRKKEIYDTYQQAFQNRSDILTLDTADHVTSAHWLYSIRVNDKANDVNSRQLISALGERRILARPLWQPMHLSPAMTGAQFVGDGASQRIFQQGVSLPSSVNLDTQQQEKVISEIFKILGP